MRAVLGALGRAHWGILTIGVTYAVAVVVGMAMAQGGNALALERRDSIVAGPETAPLSWPMGKASVSARR